VYVCLCCAVCVFVAVVVVVVAAGRPEHGERANASECSLFWQCVRVCVCVLCVCVCVCIVCVCVCVCVRVCVYCVCIHIAQPLCTVPPTHTHTRKPTAMHAYGASGNLAVTAVSSVSAHISRRAGYGV
jgi:hypothetical protein